MICRMEAARLGTASSNRCEQQISGSLICLELMTDDPLIGASRPVGEESVPSLPRPWHPPGKTTEPVFRLFVAGRADDHVTSE